MLDRRPLPPSSPPPCRGACLPAVRLRMYSYGPVSTPVLAPLTPQQAKMPRVELPAFFREYTQALRDGAAAVFVGAGISRAAGYVDWKGLLRDIASDLHLDIDRGSDLVELAQFHQNQRGARDRLNQRLIDEFLEGATLTENHRQIAALPLHTAWTTNYDDLLETAFT